MTLRRLPWLSVLLLLLLSACGSVGSARGPREQSLYDYQGAIRWSEFEAALAFVDPVVRESEPLTDLERERFKQFQVAGYLVKSVAMVDDANFEQVVEIRLINRHTQTERVITDRQRWRLDAEAKRWWLVSGLPDLDAN